MSDPSDVETNEVASSQFAVDSEVDESQLAEVARQLQLYSDRPDLLELEWSLLADELAIVQAGRETGCKAFRFIGSSGVGEDKRRLAAGVRYATRLP